MRQNEEEFEISNITTWQKDNLGEGTHIVVLDRGWELFKYYKNITVLTFGAELKEDKKKSNHGNAILATGYQIAPNSRVTYIPFDSLRGNGKDDALDWIEDNINDIDVIQMSMNYNYSWSKKWFDRFEKYKIPFFSPVGNESEKGIGSPADSPYTIAVGSVYYQSNKPSIGRESNWGKEMDVMGFSNIYYPNSKGEPVGQIGTSIASPFVAYATLLYISWRKRNGLSKLTIDEWREWQKAYALDMEEKGHDERTGYGLFRLPKEIPTIEEEDDIMKFKDTNGHWADGAIDFISDKGLLKGYEDGTFKPERAVTRAELAMVLARQNGYVEKK